MKNINNALLVCHWLVKVWDNFNTTLFHVRAKGMKVVKRQYQSIKPLAIGSHTEKIYCEYHADIFTNYIIIQQTPAPL